MKHLRRLRALLAALVAFAVLVLAVAACGGSQHLPKGALGGAPAQHHPLATARQACPNATSGNGSMGACAPTSVGLSAPHALVGGRLGANSQPSFVDLSNNDPCYCAVALRKAGYKGEIDKANQGTGFIDSTFVAMIKGARAAHLAVGGYDFDETYSVAEAKVFVSQLRAAGITPHGHDEFPAVFDVEYGAFSLAGLQAQIAYVRHQGYRVEVYTGGWYWTAHAGCTWVGVPAWLAGYPDAPIFCGLSSSLYADHQFTDHATIDGSHSSDASVHVTGSWAAEINAPLSKHARRQIKTAKVARSRNEIRMRRQHCGHIPASRRRDRARCSIERKRITTLTDQIKRLERS